jgi:nucleolar GTP-binding protein
LQNRPIIPRKKKHVSLSDFTAGLRYAGHDPAAIEKRAQRLVEQKKAAWEAAGGDEGGEGGMDVDMDGDEGAEQEEQRPKRSRALMAYNRTNPVVGAAANRTPGKNRQFIGMATTEQSEKAIQLRKFAQREPNRLAKASESDRHVPITMPKWMLAGKRKGGKTDRR